MPRQGRTYGAANNCHGHKELHAQRQAPVEHLRMPIDMVSCQWERCAVPEELHHLRRSCVPDV